MTSRIEEISRYVACGNWTAAGQSLRRALESFPPYVFYLKAERPFEQFARSGAWQPQRVLRLAVLASSTSALLAPVLRMSAFRFGLQLELYAAQYGAWRQEVLDPASPLYAFQPEAVLLLPNHEDLPPGPRGPRSHVDATVAEIRLAWQTLAERVPCRIVQAGFDLPPAGPWGSLETALPDGRRRLVYEANLALAADLPPHVSFLDMEALAADCGTPLWSEIDWLRARQYPAPAALPAFADAACAQLAAGFGLAKKILVLDLDDTLWGGIVGEDGVNGIKVGPPSAEGEGYLSLQRYCQDLRARGVLLAACSKNDADDAQRPFREHDAMLLRLEDFVVFTANWNDKAANLRDMAAALSLGLDSFVFLDDSPLEREWVRRELPQVTVPECGSHPWEMLAALRRGRWFEAVTLTQEDLNRHGMYRVEVSRRDLLRQAGSVEEFLAGLEMVATHGPVDEKTVARVAQLVNKTNQFNLTSRRHTEAQIRSKMASPEWWCRWFRLRDRFGDHGLIGVMFAHATADSRREWTVDTWLMSCRVLGRQVEQLMAHTLVESLRGLGAERIVGEYLPTAKNALVADLYPRLGFVAVEDAPGTYRADLSGPYAVPECPFIRVATPAST